MNFENIEEIHKVIGKKIEIAKESFRLYCDFQYPDEEELSESYDHQRYITGKYCKAGNENFTETDEYVNGFVKFDADVLEKCNKDYQKLYNEYLECVEQINEYTWHLKMSLESNYSK